jgi:glycosyltransferase involved in cell wall biosynthesis
LLAERSALEILMNISVAMATYNGARFITEQLASIRGQTLLPQELIISDDGSSDATLTIVEDFSRSAPFQVTILRNGRRLGFADNFLSAAEACGCPLVAFADQDDVWLPDKLRRGAQRIVEDGSALSMHTLTVTDSELRPTGFQWNQGIEYDAAYNPLQLNPFGTGWGNTMMFRREIANLIVREVRPLQPGNAEHRLSHDTWVYALSAALGRVSHIADPLILYRQHGSAATATAEQYRGRRLLRLAKVPIWEYRAHAAFDARMAELFSDLSKQSGCFAAPAAQAGACFSRRSAYWSSRVGTFDDPSFSGRLRYYKEVKRLTSDAPLWLGSRLKDLLLGVFRLGSTPIGAPLLRGRLPCAR